MTMTNEQAALLAAATSLGTSRGMSWGSELVLRRADTFLDWLNGDHAPIVVEGEESGRGHEAG